MTFCLFFDLFYFLSLANVALENLCLLDVDIPVCCIQPLIYYIRPAYL